MFKEYNVNTIMMTVNNTYHLVLKPKNSTLSLPLDPSLSHITKPYFLKSHFNIILLFPSTLLSWSISNSIFIILGAVQDSRLHIQWHKSGPTVCHCFHSTQSALLSEYVFWCYFPEKFVTKNTYFNFYLIMLIFICKSTCGDSEKSQLHIQSHLKLKIFRNGLWDVPHLYSCFSRVPPGKYKEARLSSSHIPPCHNS
jgi:hypothetical protein